CPTFWGGSVAAPDWASTHTRLLRAGFAWVGVSAQYIGVSGGPPLDRHLALKEVDPVRYGPLVHPGDMYSYDMFSQAGLAARALLAYLRPKQLIAVGQSQSAARLVTYIDA